MELQRVMVTGGGLRSPLGHGISELFEALLEGRSAVRAMPEWARVAELQALVGAPILDFDERQLPRKVRRSMGRVAMYAATAALDAVAQAGLPEALLQHHRTSLILGSTVGSTAASEAFWTHFATTNSARGMKATSFFKIMAHTAAANTAMVLGISGHVSASNAACASATQAVGQGFERVRYGRADRAVVGGADELHTATAMTFDGMGGASRGFNDSPSQTPRPFDAARDGIVCGEGAGVMVLESHSSLAARGGTALAEVLGFAGTTDAVNMASPGPDGMELAVRLAIEDAGLQPEDIDYVNAHATGTPLGDAAEAEALYRVFGDRVPVSSIKGHTGHLMGACGAIELLVCLEAMRRGVVPPTLNLDSPDVAPLWLPVEALVRPIRHVLSVNFAFGGVNTAVVLGGNASLR